MIAMISIIFNLPPAVVAADDDHPYDRFIYRTPDGRHQADSIVPMASRRTQADEDEARDWAEKECTRLSEHGQHMTRLSRGHGPGPEMLS